MMKLIESDGETRLSETMNLCTKEKWSELRKEGDERRSRMRVMKEKREIRRPLTRIT